MCAGLPLLFQHPGPVGCSPAVLHLCSEDPGALEIEWRGGCYTVCVGEGEKEEESESWRRKVGQDQLIQNAVSAKSVANIHGLNFRRRCRRVTPLCIVQYTVKYQ